PRQGQHRNRLPLKSAARAGGRWRQVGQDLFHSERRVVRWARRVPRRERAGHRRRRHLARRNPGEASIDASAQTRPLLDVRSVTVRFGGITALDAVSFAVQRGHIAGLIGPNGAGKTTLFNCLSRLYRFSEGEILFEGRSLTATPAY